MSTVSIAVEVCGKMQVFAEPAKGMCFIPNNPRNVATLVCSFTCNLVVLTIKCCLLFLLWEFTSVFTAAIYIPPQVDTNTALSDLHEAYSCLTGIQLPDQQTA